jgi:RPA family protein
MSSSDDGPGRREVAYRLFAAEFDDSEFDYSESDEERAPNYVVTPTGARVNRLFAVGVLTEVEDVNPEMVRGRVVGPTGAFVTYAGQYQPDALTFLERADPPTFLALSGKARTFEPDDGDRIYSSVRPESVSEVDAETRDRWVVTTAERTLERIGIMASAIESGLAGEQLRAALLEAGVDERLADGVALALDYYGTTPAYLDALRETALDALRVVAGEKDEVGRLDVAPDEGMGDASALATLDLSGAPSPETAAAAAGVGEAESASEADDSDDAGESAETTEPEPVSAETESTQEAEPAVSDTDTSTESESESEEGVATDESDEVETPEQPEESQSDTEPVETTADSEPAEETAAETEPTETATEPAAGADEDVREEVEEELDDFDPGEFELDEEERREVEEEYGTEFSTAGEVEEAGIETPGPEDELETAEAEASDEPEPASEAESEATEDAEDAAGADDVDLEDAVMETMEALDDGDGADRDDLVATLVEEHGVAADAVEEAIQDALMSGRCYEPSDGVLKSI